MPLVTPNYAAGSKDPLIGARNLFMIAGWIWRRCNEITTESTLDVLKIYDLAWKCNQYRDEADRWISAGEVTEVLAEIVKLTESAGRGNVTKTTSEINSDYKDLYQAAGTFLTWATNNLPGEGQTINNPTVTVNRSWPNTDFNITVTKTTPVTNAVNALAAVFA